MHLVWLSASPRKPLDYRLYNRIRSLGHQSGTEASHFHACPCSCASPVRNLNVADNETCVQIVKRLTVAFIMFWPNSHIVERLTPTMLGAAVRGSFMCHDSGASRLHLAVTETAICEAAGGGEAQQLLL